MLTSSEFCGCVRRNSRKAADCSDFFAARRVSSSMPGSCTRRRWFLSPWITGSFMPMPSTRRRTTWMIRGSAPFRVSWILRSMAAVSFEIAGLSAMIDSRSFSSSTPSVKDVPPFRSRPNRIFSFTGKVT